MSTTNCKQIPSCDSCLIEKSHFLPHKNSSTIYSPLQLIFSDIEVYKYYTNFINDATSFNWVFPMIQILEVVDIFIRFKIWSELHTSFKIKSLQTYNALEYKRLTPILEKIGIEHQQSCPYDHPWMGSVKQNHHHLVDIVPILMKHASMPKTYWDYAILTTMFLYNHNPSTLLRGISPLKALFKRILEYKKFLVFSCNYYPWLRQYRRNKLDDKSTTSMFLGYPQHHDEYLCYDPIRGNLYVLKNI